MKWLRSAVLVSVLAPLVGCSLYFDDHGGDDTRCYGTPPTDVAEILRNPETGQCQSFDITGGDPCGVAEPLAGGAAIFIPNWPSCGTFCDGLDQNTCATTIGCHAYFGDNGYPDSSIVPSSTFLACGEVGSPAPADQTDCTTLDADSCANADWCQSVLTSATVGIVGANAFEYCAPVLPTNTGSCNTDLDCAVGYSCVAVPSPDDCTEAGCPPQLFQCEPTMPPITCYTDADCGSGSQCEFTAENCDPAACPGTCVVVTPPSECYQDADCGTGYVCQFEPVDPPGPCDSVGCGAVGTCVMVPPPPETDCYAIVACDQGPPSCPSGELPAIVNACYDGTCIPVNQCADAPPSCASLPDEASCESRSDCTPIFGGQGCTCDPASDVCNCPVITYQSCQAITPPTCESLATLDACAARTDCQAVFDNSGGCDGGPDGTLPCPAGVFVGCVTPQVF